MEYQESKSRFIESWGELSCSWGMSKTLGHIHAILLLSPNSMAVKDISSEVDISEHCTKTHLKTLEEWKIVSKEKGSICNKCVYTAEKNVWKVFQNIVENRKKKELEPLLALLSDIKQTEGNCQDCQELLKVTNDWYRFSSKVDKALQRICQLEEGLIMRTFLAG